VIILLVLFSCFSVACVFGYDNNIIHPGLSAKAIENHNKTSENKINSRQRAWMIEGSIAEDADPRYLNHFYDPTIEKGLNDGLFKGVSAKEWAKKQNSVSGDYSENAIFLNYKNGNKKRAFQGIGHIIHLIQDMSVPAHTRNDSHPKGDPYEGWAKQYGKIETNNDFIYVNNLDFVFDSLATYSNNNFYSKDTIDELISTTESKYEINSKGNNSLYFYKGNYKLVRVIKNKENNIYVLDDDVHKDYWRMLHPKAVAYSSGVIDYFMREFKEIDKNENKEDKGFLGYIKDSISQTVNNFKYGFGDTIMAAHASIDNLKTGYDQYEKFASESAVKIETGLKDFNGKVLGVISSDLLPESENEEQGIVSSVSASVKESKQENNNQENNFTNFAEANSGEGINDLENKQKENKVSIEVLDNFTLKRVIDGDTIELQSGEKVRYIGIDAPEIGNNECLAFESMQRNKEMLNRGELKLIKDPSVSSDKYGRLLRYVYVGDTFINSEIIKEGLAEPFFCEPGWENCPVTSDQVRKKEILASYNFAKENKLGLFSEVCEIKEEVVLEEESNSKEADVFPVHLFTSGEPEDTPPLAGTGQAPPSTGTGQAPPSTGTGQAPPSTGTGQAPPSTGTGQAPPSTGTGQAPPSTGTGQANINEDINTNEDENENTNINEDINTNINEDINTNVNEDDDESSEDEESTGHEEDESDEDTNETNENEDENTNVNEDDDESSEDEESTGHENNEDEEEEESEDTEGDESGEDGGGDEFGAYVVISQIKISGESARDEFVELYNLSDQDINLTDYRLSKKTASGNEYNLLTSFPETIIKAKGYLLIGHPEEYIGEVIPDLSYSTSQSIAADNSVILYSDAGDTIIDLVGFGEASDFETEVFPDNPDANQSLIRKASASSTLDSILSGVEKNSGNGQDSDNNREDFLLGDSLNPRNSQYSGEENRENEDEVEEDDESEPEEESELSRILVDNKTGTSTPWGDNLKWEHNISGSDRLLVVTVHQNARNRIIDSIKYGSLDLTLAVKETGMRSNMLTFIYYLIDPPIGSDSIYIHFTLPGYYGASAISLNSVNTLNPIATTSNHFFQDDKIRTEIETDKKAMLVDSFSLKAFNQEVNSDSNQTEIFNKSIGDTTNPFWAGSSYKWADSTGTWDMLWDFDYNSVWSHVIVAINPKQQDD
jgi:endonuclease YncB( thermonuclease family)